MMIISLNTNITVRTVKRFIRNVEPAFSAKTL